jgi:hypothetical protein
LRYYRVRKGSVPFWGGSTGVDTPRLFGRRSFMTGVYPLGPFEQDERFATGFDQEDGLEHFKSMAVSTNTDLGKSCSLKFYIDDFRHNPKVYFQNTKDYPLHHMFGASDTPFPCRDLLGGAPTDEIEILTGPKIAISAHTVAIDQTSMQKPKSAICTPAAKFPQLF